MGNHLRPITEVESGIKPFPAQKSPRPRNVTTFDGVPEFPKSNHGLQESSSSFV